MDFKIVYHTECLWQTKIYKKNYLFIIVDK